MRTAIYLAIITIMSIGCANYPADIQPIPVPNHAYADWSCDRITSEYGNIATRLTEASKQQQSKAEGDALGVFLIFIPLGSGPDREAEIAEYKGILATLRGLGDDKGCDVES